MDNTINKVQNDGQVVLAQANVSEEQMVRKPKSFGRLLLVFALLLLICATLYYFLFYKKDSVLEKGLDKEQGQVFLKEPEGEIYLTLSPLGEEKPNIYKLDLESMDLEEFFPESSYRNYMAKFSPDGEKMVFVRGYEDDTHEILLFDNATQEAKSLTERIQNFPRNPSFSTDGESIVYWVYDSEKPETSLSELADYAIYEVDLRGEQVMLARGAFPLFSGDGNYVIYLEEEGLHTVNLATSENQLVLNLSTDYLKEMLKDENFGRDLPSWASLRFNYSPIEDVLIVTDTLGSRNYMFKINSWDNFSYEVLFDLEFYIPNWPVFSPDGKYFAIQEFGSEEVLSSQISVFDLAKVENQKFLGIAEYDPGFIWVSDWIVRK